MSAILPGATIGILGGGQLGRMTALFARQLGYHLRALDPDPSCAARFVVDRCLTAAFDDPEAAAELAQGCAVVTLEIEKVGLPSLEAAGRLAPVRPGPQVLGVVQDRGRQKAWLREHGFPVGPYRLVQSAGEAEAAARAFGRCFLKACTGGYDGRGQVRLEGAAQAGAAFAEVSPLGQPCVVEQALDLQAELSVLVARRPGGEIAIYPPSWNHHEHQILAWSVMPGPFSAGVAAQAVEIGRALAVGLAVEGLLAVEMFLCQDGRLLVNELAPRPHNTFHTTEVASKTSQFEQLVRAVCDLPLGAVDIVQPAAIVNLLGDLWLGERPPAFDRALSLPGVRLHLYGKRVPRPGRKMGHLSASAATPEKAVALVNQARARLLEA